MRKYEHLESEIVKDYNSGLSQWKIAKKFGIPVSSMPRILSLNGVEVRKGNQNKKHSCNDNYFSVIDTAEKAYILGFLAADGNISKRDNQISIGLSAKDREHLIRIKKALSLTNNIIDYDHNLYGKICKTSLLVWTSAQMKKDLAKHFVVPQKSKTIKFSKHIPNKFLNSYILGIIDGDGSFHLDKQNQMHISIVGTYEILLGIQNVLVANCDVNLNKIGKDKRCEHTYYLTFGGNQSIVRIASFLYDEENRKITLPRKLKIIESYIR